MGNNKIKMDIRPLMCRLTEDELKEQGKILTELLQDKMDLEIEKSSNNKRFTDLIKAKDVQIEKQIPVVRDRQIERDVECRIEFNHPEPGKKTVTRLDTMEIIFEGQMTDSECQDLFINTPEDENAQGQKLLAAPVDAEEVIDGEVTGIGDGEETDESDLADKTDKKEIRRPVVCETCGHPGELYHLAQGKLICSRCLDIKNQKNLVKIEAAIAEKQEILVRPAFGFGVVSESADLTCFRFTIGGKTGGKGSSWGTPVYLPGDYRTEGTDAAVYFKKLSELGIKEG